MLYKFGKEYYTKTDDTSQDNTAVFSLEKPESTMSLSRQGRLYTLFSSMAMSKNGIILNITESQKALVEKVIPLIVNYNPHKMDHQPIQKLGEFVSIYERGESKEGYFIDKLKFLITNKEILESIVDDVKKNATTYKVVIVPTHEENHVWNSEQRPQDDFCFTLLRDNKYLSIKDII